MAEVAKSVTFPAEVAAELEAAAFAADRSLAAEVRIAVRKHLADVVSEAKTAPSGFSQDDAAALGVRVYKSGPGRWMGEIPGSPQAWGPTSLSRVLAQVEDWHNTRRARDDYKPVASPQPVTPARASATIVSDVPGGGF